MAFNGSQITIFRNGTTPADGTICLGSTFNNEFNRLYANWNTFFNAAGNQFSIDRINVDNLYSIDGDGINFHDPIGYNIDAPVANLQLNQGDSGACLAHFTNLTTGAAIGNGLSIGLDSSENGIINLKENKDLLFYTNNTLRMTIDNAGDIAIGAISPSYDFHIRKDEVFAVIGSTDVSKYAIWGIQDDSSVFKGSFGYGNASVSDSDRQSKVFFFTAANVDLLFKIGNSSVGIIEGATGNFGIGTISPSNRLHVLSTTTPQFRIAYDTDSYITMSVANGGDFTIACGEATGRINLTPGASDALVYITGAAQTTGNMTIGGTLSLTGNMITDLIISDTTESSSKDTGSIVTEGGIGAEKNIQNGGYLKSGLGRWPTGSINGNNITSNNIFDAMDAKIPNINDAIIVSGAIYESTNDLLSIISKAIRHDATTIYLYCVEYNHNADTATYIIQSIVNGSGTVWESVSLAW